MKGQVVFLGLMIAVTIIVLALALAPATNEITKGVMNTTNSLGEASGMDCSNASISDYDKGACTLIDLTVPYFIGGLLALAGIIIFARIVLQNV